VDWKYIVGILGALATWIWSVFTWFRSQAAQRAQSEFNRKEGLYRELLRTVTVFYKGGPTTGVAPFLDQYRLAWLYAPDDVVKILTSLVAPNGSFFVTSDNPCVWFNPLAYRVPPLYRSAGLAMKDIEITMPITPEVLALVTHPPSVSGYLNLTDMQVQELNRRSVGFSDEQFVSRSPDTLPIWFDPGTPPPDAWENRVSEENEVGKNPFEK
jgi:hypothetical protein